MILNNAPQNEAIVSNVSEIGEFRIRNSAKAFSILSSGLYANKVRAIVRELSCNAVDSHAAAGKQDTPFDVHLPNTLEPWFAIRDYGTGLSHEQVTQIYTTYFESTKTNSNEFIGALGLGSKSPFSYTDNFTVTAIQNGKKGIYSAFINAEGVPSIALMMQEETAEPAGVEVRFSVNDRYDFDKFRQEARTVYKHFSLKPVVSGNSSFTFELFDYESRDIIPGVHQVKGQRASVAIMGNIAYPIEVPAADNTISDEVRQLLSCGMEMHFAIGELDFQASREGLSYIPSTVAAIKSKLEAVRAVLVDKLAVEADAVTNLWDRALFLTKRKTNPLWSAAVVEYAVKNPIPTYNSASYTGCTSTSIKVEDLEKQYNVRVRCFTKNRGSATCHNSNSRTDYGDTDANGVRIQYQYWQFAVDSDSHFVVNDLKTGAAERAKYHYRHSSTDASVYSRAVYILEKADKDKTMNLVGFFDAIHNPPEARRFVASSLLEKPRAAGLGKNVTIMKLERRGGRSGYNREQDMVWRDAGKADSFDANETYYYVPLTGFQMVSSKGYGDAKHFHGDVTSLPGLFKGEIYGVRKGDIVDIKQRKNWVNLEEHITSVLNSKDNSKLLMSVVKAQVESYSIFEMPNTVLGLIDANSPYNKLVNEFKGVDKFKGSVYNLNSLFAKFAPKANLSPDALVNKYNQLFREVASRYPLISKLSSYRCEASDIAEYINLIDTKKGI
jgi:hypothetical protein